jgi:hypothetical protein
VVAVNDLTKLGEKRERERERENTGLTVFLSPTHMVPQETGMDWLVTTVMLCSREKRTHLKY